MKSKVVLLRTSENEYGAMKQTATRFYVSATTHHNCQLVHS